MELHWFQLTLWHAIAKEDAHLDLVLPAVRVYFTAVFMVG